MGDGQVGSPGKWTLRQSLQGVSSGVSGDVHLWEGEKEAGQSIPWDFSLRVGQKWPGLGLCSCIDQLLDVDHVWEGGSL